MGNLLANERVDATGHELNQFLGSHRVLAIERRWVDLGRELIPRPGQRTEEACQFSTVKPGTR